MSLPDGDENKPFLEARTIARRGADFVRGWMTAAFSARVVCKLSTFDRMPATQRKLAEGLLCQLVRARSRQVYLTCPP